MRGRLRLATVQALPSRHPLRAFIQPFIIETFGVNGELYRLFRATAEQYCKKALGGIDPPVRAWLGLMDKYIPGGILRMLGVSSQEEVTLEQLAHVVAVTTFTVSVSHHLVAGTVRDYMMSVSVMPPAVGEDGHPSRGQVLEKLNSMTVAGILRDRLMDDSVVLPEGPARAIWKDFQAALEAVEAKVDASPASQRPCLLRPSRIPSSIHA